MEFPFQSTLPAGGATPCQTWPFRYSSISIHAPRRGSDARRRFGVYDDAGISIHAPRRESDFLLLSPTDPISYFNPRSPQGERPFRPHYHLIIFDFNPRSPQGERPGEHLLLEGLIDFNPRSPQGERRDCTTCEESTLNFNPRSPQGERLVCQMPNIQRQ